VGAMSYPLALLVSLALLPGNRVPLLAPSPDSMFDIVVVVLALLVLLPAKEAKGVKGSKVSVPSTLEPLSAWDALVWLVLLLHECGPASDQAIYRAAERQGLSRDEVDTAARQIGVMEVFPGNVLRRPLWSLPRLSDYYAPFRRDSHPDLRFQPEPCTRTQAPSKRKPAA